MDDSQLLRGILEGCILSIISKKETYGYEILITLSNNNFENLLEGTLYPVLTRLNNKGYIACTKKESAVGPIRKYYSITDLGKEKLEQFKKEYKRITDNANKILIYGEENDEK
ncbi:MAG: PadR family transcriptional regulator [Clostridiaceae bacterium]|nr:PadR family transcriptional regulator [Clostridiaceae bacterium]